MNNESLDTKKPFVVRLLAALGIIVILLLIAFPAHCATAHPKHENGLGVTIPYENPFIYNFGIISAGQLVRDPTTKKIATNIRFQPFRTFELYSEELLFCGDRADDFSGMTGPVIITYKRVAHETLGGVACHELENVQKVTTADKDNQ